MENQINEILRKYTRDDAVWDTADATARLREDLKINSARVVDIVMDIEDAFGITIDDDEVDLVETVHELVALVRKTVPVG